MQGPLLPPAARRKTLLAAGPAVIACVAENKLEFEELDPGMHGRLEVEADATGKARVTQVQIAYAATAPRAFIDCAMGALKRVELELAPETRGVVVTPPFAGEK